MMKKEKKPHGVQLLIRAVVRDPEGKIITDTGRKPSKSFLIQFLEFVYGMFEGLSVIATSIIDDERAINLPNWMMSQNFLINAAIADDSKGIMIGTGDTAETNVDYSLETRLTEGVGAGNIPHGAQVVGSAAVVGANVDLELIRAFTNSTGSTITVKEAGLHVFLSGVPHCIIRDVLSPSVDVPNMCSLTVYYTVRTTV